MSMNSRNKVRYFHLFVDCDDTNSLCVNDCDIYFKPAVKVTLAQTDPHAASWPRFWQLVWKLKPTSLPVPEGSADHILLWTLFSCGLLYIAGFAVFFFLKKTS